MYIYSTLLVCTMYMSYIYGMYNVHVLHIWHVQCTCPTYMACTMYMSYIYGMYNVHVLHIWHVHVLPIWPNSCFKLMPPNNASNTPLRGVHPDFFVKLDFEIAVYRQTRPRDRTFRGVPESGCPPVPAGQPRPYLVNFWLNFAKSP